MPASHQLSVSIGQHSDKGRKPLNQDFHGARVPAEPLLGSKGIAVAIADGISTSAVSQEASESAVCGFLEDYFCTSDAWSVKRSAQRVLAATNAWLHGQTQRGVHRFDKDRGYVCTLSALVLKSVTAHVFHVGDSRVYRVHPNSLEQLTEDHRLHISAEQSYLSRAMGAHPTLEIDYLALRVEVGDIFVLATDGVYEHIQATTVQQAMAAHPNDLDAAAQAVVEVAYQQGSPDNLTVQIVRIDTLPQQNIDELAQQRASLLLPPVMAARDELDGYRIVRELHASGRSHIYLAQDIETGQQVVLKTPSIDMQADEAYLERFLLEEWIARRIDSPYVLKTCAPARQRKHLFVVMEYIQGQTLAQWMNDHPKPGLETVRSIVEQIGKGLQAFHRMEMLHQDLRPANILIDATGSVKIIDFGATLVAGLAELAPEQYLALLGTAQYTAPEYFLGESGTPRSDLFSLAVITYQMLTGELPYGAEVAKTRTLAEQRRLHMGSLVADRQRIPIWVEGALRRALQPEPFKRYEDPAEFAYDLRHPNREFLLRRSPPLIERNPLAFWKGLSALLLVALLLALLQISIQTH